MADPTGADSTGADLAMAGLTLADNLDTYELPDDDVGVLEGEDAIVKPNDDVQIDCDDTFLEDAALKYYCRECGATWLQGRAGRAAVRRHPTHNAHEYNAGGGERWGMRSVWVCLGVARDHEPTADTWDDTGIGIYYGPQSPLNLSRVVNLGQDSLTAVAMPPMYMAAALAMYQVQHKIMAPRLHLAPQTRRFRLVFGLDSTFFVATLLHYVPRWTLDYDNGYYIDEDGLVVDGSVGLIHVREETEALARCGVHVGWCEHPPCINREAMQLAWDALGITDLRPDGA